MAHAPFLSFLAIVQLLPRLLSVALCIATLAVAIYASAKLAYGRVMIGAYIAAIWTITVDVREIVGSTSPKRASWHCTDGRRALVSLLTMLICAVVPVSVTLFHTIAANRRFDCGNSVKECDAKLAQLAAQNTVGFLSWVLPVAVAGIHFFLSVAACIGLCREKRQSRILRKNAVVLDHDLSPSRPT